MPGELCRGRREPIHGGLTAAFLAADILDKAHPASRAGLLQTQKLALNR